MFRARRSEPGAISALSHAPYPAAIPPPSPRCAPPPSSVGGRSEEGEVFVSQIVTRSEVLPTRSPTGWVTQAVQCHSSSAPSFSDTGRTDPVKSIAHVTGTRSTGTGTVLRVTCYM